MNDGKLTAAKLRACTPYECDAGKFLQLPCTPVFQYTIVNGTGAYLAVPGLEQGFPPAYDFLVHGISSIVSLPYTYVRIQWPTGRFLSQVPVDVWNMGGTGRNGRLLMGGQGKTPSKGGVFIPKGEIVRLEVGTQQAQSTVQLFFEGCILIPQ